MYALILLPVVWPILKDVYHHCPACLAVPGAWVFQSLGPEGL